MLVAEIAGASDDLAEVRKHCETAIGWLLSQDLECVVVLASAAGRGHAYWDQAAGGSFAGVGVDLQVGGGDSSLPTDLSIGAWLLDRAGWEGRRQYCLGPIVSRGRTGVIVMADGSARLSATAPGYFDDRASGYDESICNALRDGDRKALANIDTDLAKSMWSNAADALQELARVSEDYTISAAVHYYGAPYGVGYWVATWGLVP